MQPFVETGKNSLVEYTQVVEEVTPIFKDGMTYLALETSLLWQLVTDAEV